MRIREFSIRRYGPLPDTGRVQLGDFSLLFGKNEDGKTLTIDALVKLLLRRGRGIFKHIKRVDEDPEGYLVMEDDEGKEVKLPHKGDLTDITDLTAEECRNIFIIRNSDLSIAPEAEFYRNVTDRLTGLRSEEILSIKKQLEEMGKLTRPDSTASLRDRAGEKLKSRTISADMLIVDIETLEKKIKDEEFDRFEEALLKFREKGSEVSRKIEALEDARRREKYEEGHKAYGTLMSAREDLKALQVYSTDDANLWAACDRDISNWTKDMERLQSEVGAKKAEREQKAKEWNEEKLIFEALDDRKKRIDDDIKPEINIYVMKSGELKAREAKGRFFTLAAIASAVLLSISTAGIIMSTAPLLYVLFALFLTSTVVFATLRFLLAKDKAWLVGLVERIKLTASRFELSGETIEQILPAIQKFEEDYSKKQEELKQAGEGKSRLDSEIKRLVETDIAGIERKTVAARERIEDVARKAEVRTLQEYHEKLKLKLSHEKAVNIQLEILKSHFGSKGEGSEEELSHWRGEIEVLKEFESKAGDITYDEKTVSQLRAEQEEIRSKEQEFKSKIDELRRQLREIEGKANGEILQLEDEYLHCYTSVDLQAIKARLAEFIAEVEREKDNALSAIRIFESLETEEEEKISSLFGRDSLISNYFREITGGVYEEAEFTSDDAKRVQVRFRNGDTLDAADLSGGAYDQLYLSIRLALAEKLLKGSKGFFIMDDPFIKADKGRLQRQIDILKNISKLGWQVMYFTAKDEVRDVLKDDIDSGKVGYIELQGIFPR